MLTGLELLQQAIGFLLGSGKLLGGGQRNGFGFRRSRFVGSAIGDSGRIRDGDLGIGGLREDKDVPIVDGLIGILALLTAQELDHTVAGGSFQRGDLTHGAGLVLKPGLIGVVDVLTQQIGHMVIFFVLEVLRRLLILGSLGSLIEGRTALNGGHHRLGVGLGLGLSSGSLLLGGFHCVSVLICGGLRLVADVAVPILIGIQVSLVLVIVSVQFVVRIGEFRLLGLRILIGQDGVGQHLLEQRLGHVLPIQELEVGAL